MTQQTHPHETSADTTDSLSGDPREPRWYDGPWNGANGANGASAANGASEAPSAGTSSADTLAGTSPDTSWGSPTQPSRESTGQGEAFGLQREPEAGTATREFPLAWNPGAMNPPTTSTPTTSIPTSSATPTSPTGSPAGTGWSDGGWGGPTGFTPPPAPSPAPSTRRGLGVAGTVGIALLAAVVGSGATLATVHYGGSSIAGSTVGTTTSVPAPVAQASANSPDWVATAKAVAPSVVSIDVKSSQAEGQGSGVVIDSQGHILTNNHVATGAGSGASISVTLNDGRTYDATIVGTDATTDLAVLKLTNGPSDLTPISIGDSTALTVGQPVMAIGNPLGLSGTVTTGIVSALNRPTATQAESQGQGQSGDSGSGQVVTNAIQTSAAINPGNSGGALVTANGQLIGINSSIASLSSGGGDSQSGSIGIGFAIPVKEAKNIADQLIQNGTAQHAYLGVSAQDTTVTDGASKRAAAIIRKMDAGTPAANAGLKVGDAVIAVDGQSIDSAQSLVGTIHGDTVGDKVTVTVIRDGAKQDISVTLAARPGQS